jgi:hypothetical protein
LPVYLILTVLLGPLGVHNIAARRYGRAACQCLLSITVFGLFVSLPWILMDIFTTRTDGDGLRMR